MSAEGQRGLNQVSQVLLLSGALAMLALLCWTVAPRLTHPYDLEWMEGGMLVHAERVRLGLPLYVEPGPDFVPFIYPPLTHWIIGLFGHLGGVGYFTGRSLSLLGTLVAAGALAVGLRKEGNGIGWALSGAALYLSTYDETGAFFDLVRTDGLFMGLLTTALVAGRHNRPVISGILLTLAFMTKHNAAAFGIPILIWLWREHGKQAGIRFVAASVGPALLFLLAMQWEGDGLFLTYLLRVPAAHPLVFSRLMPGSEIELASALPWGVAGSAVGLAVGGPFRGPSGRYWVPVGALALALCALMRAHHGGFLNVLMPGMWVLAFGGILGIQALRERWPTRNLLFVGLGTVGTLVQLGFGSWDPERYHPRPEDRAAGDALVERLQAVEGKVWAPWSPWLAVQAGKTPGTHLIALWDIDHDGGVFHDRIGSIRSAVAENRWSLIVGGSAKESEDLQAFGLRKHYRVSERLNLPGEALFPRTGWRVRPRRLWAPNTEPEASPGGGEP